MTNQLILDCLERTQETEKMVVSNRLDPHPADNEAFGQRILANVLKGQQSLVRGWQHVQEALWAHSEEMDVQMWGETLLEMCSRCMAVIRQVIAYLNDHNCGSAEDVKRLSESMDEVKQMDDDVRSRWPWMDAERFKEPASGCSPTRYYPAKEVFDELRRRFR